MKRNPCSQRIPHQVARSLTDDGADRLRDEVGGLRKVGPHGVGPSVAGQVHRHQRVRVAEEVAEAAEEPARLGEAVEHHEGRTRPAHLDMEWHAG